MLPLTAGAVREITAGRNSSFVPIQLNPFYGFINVFLYMFNFPYFSISEFPILANYFSNSYINPSWMNSILYFIYSDERPGLEMSVI